MSTRPYAILLFLVVGTVSCSPPVQARAPQDTFTQVEPPVSWRNALASGRIPAPPDEDQLVKVASPDGTSFFAQVTRPGWRGLVWFSRGRPSVVVTTLPDPSEQQFVGGGFDGRFLVFAIRYDRARPDDWTVHAWDSQAGGPPREIANNRRALKSPWIHPVVQRGKAAWIVGTDDLGAQVHLYDLVSGTDRVVHDRPATEAFFTDEWLVWRDGHETTAAPLHAVEIGSGSAVRLPPALAQARSWRYANGSGQAVVWVERGDGPPGQRLFAWRAGWERARLVAVARGAGESIEWPCIAGELVAWGNLEAYFVADLRTGRYAQVTPRFGSVTTWGDALVVQQYGGGKQVGGDTALLRARDLPAL